MEAAVEAVVEIINVAGLIVVVVVEINDVAGLIVVVVVVVISTFI